MDQPPLALLGQRPGKLLPAALRAIEVAREKVMLSVKEVSAFDRDASRGAVERIRTALLDAVRSVAVPAVGDNSVLDVKAFVDKGRIGFRLETNSPHLLREDPEAANVTARIEELAGKVDAAAGGNWFGTSGLFGPAEPGKPARLYAYICVVGYGFTDADLSDFLGLPTRAAFLGVPEKT